VTAVLDPKQSIVQVSLFLKIVMGEQSAQSIWDADSLYINNLFINEEKRPERLTWFRRTPTISDPRLAPPGVAAHIPLDIVSDRPQAQTESKMFSDILNIGTLNSRGELSDDETIGKLCDIIDHAASTNIAARTVISQNDRPNLVKIKDAIVKKYAISKEELDSDEAAFNLPCWKRPIGHWAYGSYRVS
jgi:hypothetical protein